MTFEKERFLKLVLDKKNNEALKMLNTYLVENPNNLFLRVGKACYLSEYPFFDYWVSLEILNDVLGMSPQYDYAIVLKGVIEYLNEGNVSENTFCLLKRPINTDGEETELSGDMFTLMALYYKGKDPDQYCYYLIEAIKASPHYVMPYKELSDYQKQNGYYREALESIENAIKNSAGLLADDDFIDPLDIEEYLNVYFRDTRLGAWNYEELIYRREYLKAIIFEPGNQTLNHSP